MNSKVIIREAGRIFVEAIKDRKTALVSSLELDVFLRGSSRLKVVFKVLC